MMNLIGKKISSLFLALFSALGFAIGAWVGAAMLSREDGPPAVEIHSDMDARIINLELEFSESISKKSIRR